MNVFITVALVVVFAVFVFFVGCFACISKIEQLEAEKKTLTEWLKASQDANKILIKDLNKTRSDLEAVVNGGHILASTITADKITVTGENETKTD